MTDNPRWPSYRAALAEALENLDRLRSHMECVDEDGRCTTHDRPAARCPHLSARLLMERMTAELPATPYPAPVLIAILRGLTAGQDAFVSFSADGYAHTGRLRGGWRGPDDEPEFWVEKECGGDPAVLDPADILTLEVRFTGEFGRTLTPGVIASLKEQIADKTASGEITP